MSDFPVRADDWRMSAAVQARFRLSPAHCPGAPVQVPLEAEKRNLYDIFPADLSSEEIRFAKIAETSHGLDWWHRKPVRSAESVALYRWSHGVGFFPDFLVAVKDQKAGDGVALESPRLS